jgi:hypothetical protein
MRLKLLGILTAVATCVGLVAATGTPAAADTASRSSSRALGYTQVVVDPAVYQLIASAGITPSPVSPAVAFPYRGTLAARFPITGVAAPATVTHAGGLTLAAGADTITLTDFTIELARLTVSGNVSGSIGTVGRADLFTLGLSHRPWLGLLSLRLTATAADALNATFGVSAFSAGDIFGYATVVPRLGRHHGGWHHGDRHLSGLTR